MLYDQMPEPSFRTAFTEIKDGKADSSFWITVLNREGSENRSNRMHLNMEQTETLQVAESKPQADNFVSSKGRMASNDHLAERLLEEADGGERDFDLFRGIIAHHSAKHQRKYT